VKTIDLNSTLGGRQFCQDRRVSADPNYQGIEKRISGDRRKETCKRKSPRFRAKEGSYVAVDSNHNIVGFIKNINKYGLAFQYVANAEELTGMLTMDIFRNNREFYLNNVFLKTVSDFYVDNKTPFSTIILRECGGEFVDLTDNKKSQLDRFIQNFTLGVA